MAEDINSEALKLHEKLRGKIEVHPKIEVKTKHDLALVYTPGVAEPCRRIARNKSLAYKYTMKSNTVAIVSDGSAVLGLGNIGAHAAIPVMEGKSLIFKQLAGINCIPICLESQDPEVIIQTVKNISPIFGAINLEDISAPKCFYIERRLREELSIPIMHDDQQGTAIVVLAAFINSIKVAKKGKDLRIVIIGAGAAGHATAALLAKFGFSNIVVVDSKGIVSKSRKDLDEYKIELLKFTNRDNFNGSLRDALKGADAFVGLSAPGILTAGDVKLMNSPIVFAMANPVPEIMPDEAIKGGAVIVGTGRSDFPNQVNNSLSFPGVFKGTLDSGVLKITDKMKLAAAKAIAALVERPTRDQVLPDNLDPRVVPAVSRAVAEAK